jgi:diphthine synthase
LCKAVVILTVTKAFNQSHQILGKEGRHLGDLVFVGLGLHDHMGLSLQGLEEIKAADAVFLELYTSLLPDFSHESLKRLTGKKITLLHRKDLEDNGGRIIFEAAEKGKTVLLVPGDPLIATTHVTLRIEAKKRKIQTRIVHGASILSAAIGLSGLHNYKFGKSVTIPFWDENPSITPYSVIGQNKRLGLHTLCLLDIDVENRRFLKVNDALKVLLEIEHQKNQKIISNDTLAVGVARAGSASPTVKAGFVGDLVKKEFGDPPHTLIFPGKLHFMEAEALVFLGDAPEKVRRLAE